MTPFTYATDSGTLAIRDEQGDVFIEVFDGSDQAFAFIPNSAVPRIASALLDAAGYGETETPDVLRSENPGKTLINAARRLAEQEPEKVDDTSSAMANLVEGWGNVRSLYHSALDKWLSENLGGIAQADKRMHYDEGYANGYTEAQAKVDAPHLPWKYAMKSDTSSLDEITRAASEDGTADAVDEFVNTRPKFTEGDRVVRRSDKYNDQPGIVTTRTFTRMGDPAWMVQWDDDPEEEEGPYQDWELRKL